MSTVPDPTAAAAPQPDTPVPVAGMAPVPQPAARPQPAQPPQPAAWSQNSAAAFVPDPEVGWPQIPEEMRPILDAMVSRLTETGSRSSMSAESENVLLAHVTDMMTSALREPERFGIVPAMAARIEADPKYRALFTRALLIRASVLWPLSLLVYGGDYEEIRRMGNTWMVESADGVKVLIGPEPRDFAATAEVTADKHIEEWFRGLLSMRGIVGVSGLSAAKPIVEAGVPSVIGPIRIAVAIAPVITGRSTVAATIRIPRPNGPQSLEEFVQVGTLPAGVARFLRAAVLAQLNIVIAGGTGTGKTTLMRALASQIPANEFIVAIEDTAELQLDQPRRDGRPWHPRVISLSTVNAQWGGQVSAIKMEDLVRTALRHRPHRIILGEARGPEMADAASAMTSGHSGALFTIHADSALEAQQRATMYVAQSDQYRGDAQGGRELVRQAFQMCVHLGHKRDSRRRMVDGVAVYQLDGTPVNVYGLNDDGDLIRMADSLEALPARVSKPLLRQINEIPAV